MFLSRIELRPVQPDNAAQVQAFWSKSPSAYDLHRVVWTWFGDRPDRRRDFLYRIENDDPRSGLRIYTLSPRSPSVDGRLWRIAVKEYTPGLQEGDELAFLLRANATVSRSQEGKRSKRHDVVMDAVTRLKAAGEPVGSRPAIAQEVGAAWLAKRSEGLGFSVVSGAVAVDRYQPVRFRRRGKIVSFSQLDFQGRLTVTDPVRFLKTLMEGVGRAKGFGCGLMMVRRL